MTHETADLSDLESAWTAFSDALRGYLARRVRNPHDVDDLLQDVFLKLATASPAVPEERLGRWLVRVARNALVDAHRRGRVRMAAPLGPEAAAVEDDRAARSLTRCLGPMIRTLPAIYAEALEEVELRGRSQKALAEEAGLSHSAIKSRVQRGRVLLRERIEACCRPTDDLDCADEAACP